MIEVKEFRIDGLCGWQHITSRDALARVLLVHGLGEHSGRHVNTITQLVRHGYECVRFDLRGHGLSAGERQWVESFDDYLDDLHAIVTWSEQRPQQIPTYLYGHSLGGAICLRYAAQRPNPLSGLMINAPAFRIGSGVSWLRQLLARSLNAILPRLSLSANLDLSAISRDPEEIARAANDPLNCHYNTVRQGYEILKALPELRRNVECLNIPLLLTHGKQDRLVAWQGTEELFQSCGSVDKECVYFADGFHELHNDLDRERYWRCLLDWLARHNR